jgi:hypothetical protein
VAAANFDAACRDGIEAVLRWPRGSRGSALAELPAVELVRDELLPLAAAGLDAWGIDPVDRDRYLGVIEGRCRRRTNGALWQSRNYHRHLERGLDRGKALSEMTKRYIELMHTDVPVHEWPESAG